MRITSTVLMYLLASTLSLFAAAPQPAADLKQTLSAAAEQKKMGFILLGRSTCSICNETRAMIHEGKIPVTATHYVMADLNIDDEKTQAAFMSKYGKEDFGNTLPFIVITDSQGTALASSGGYKDAMEWEALLRVAQAKAKKTSADSKSSPGGAGKSDPNRPSKSAPVK